MRISNLLIMFEIIISVGVRHILLDVTDLNDLNNRLDRLGW